MAEKKTEDGKELDNASKQPTELDSLRQIVFGAAQDNIEKRINALEQQTHNSFQRMEKLLEKNMQIMQSKMEDGFNNLEDKLALADQGQDQKASELNAYADRISSAYEMAEANSKQENDELHNRLDKEIRNLNNNFTEQLNQALAKLNQVSSDLNSSKTDRKTLAKLLASVANDLETGEDL
ncbi:hypothetical protein RS130_06515 [Paraglaciecola aquimarina]|uniref:Uncharacterized protein n=1 Tax=Paraglaciecola aquimarina TaxID=1235557 RepID=A0ABU3SUF9_9ALTE|nr:hypothetical protein [Paraglaciecola aquimarina]MDU0353628.1 hypothetical protein [Paraglaciecola aquimarina]